MIREPGMSARLKLALSYVGFLMVAGVLLMAVVWVFLLRYVPRDAASTIGGFMPGRNDLIKAFLPAAVWALVFLLAFGMVGGWILAGRMLAPLTRITDAARKAANGTLSHRIELEGSQDEFRELADAFDAMLGRLEAQVAEQRRFAANASHELRTPLAISQALIDVARSDPAHDQAELLERLRAVNARAIDLTEALLVLSRAEQQAFTPERVDLSLLAEEAAEILLPLAEKRAITLDTSGDIAPTVGSPHCCCS
jgi:two-component system sensor histidine kinase VanS